MRAYSTIAIQFALLNCMRVREITNANLIQQQQKQRKHQYANAGIECERFSIVKQNTFLYVDHHRHRHTIRFVLLSLSRFTAFDIRCRISMSTKITIQNYNFI